MSLICSLQRAAFDSSIARLIQTELHEDTKADMRGEFLLYILLFYLHCIVLLESNTATRKKNISGRQPLIFFHFKSPTILYLKAIPNVHNTVCYMFRWYVQKKWTNRKKKFKYEAVVPQTHVGNSLGVIHWAATPGAVLKVWLLLRCTMYRHTLGKRQSEWPPSSGWRCSSLLNTCLRGEGSA